MTKKAPAPSPKPAPKPTPIVPKGGPGNQGPGSGNPR